VHATEEQLVRPTDRSRRRLLTGLLALPAAGAAAAAATKLGANAALLRPNAAGGSAGRCARCGATDHHMLSDVCAPELRLVRT
jgi:hypothetical protein